ncbi:acyl carrier protein [Dysgonomonas sp. 520]|uniref:acyl carrier protein n=1 Tax=Dysgonomonas sp. 520 TaxID=2302931 RepID=UPI0013D5DEC0|nr:acyl carrier protein [Dysgonomonas sp. 520]NDW09141.1 acyl carrier protein [Dysgonomonas sp. 520]
MERSQVLEEVNEIFKDILDNDEINLTDTSTADDVEEWDSLTHIQLVVAVEKHFDIRFKSKEIQSWNNVGEMINSITEKIQ